MRGSADDFVTSKKTSDMASKKTSKIASDVTPLDDGDKTLCNTIVFHDGAVLHKVVSEA